MKTRTMYLLTLHGAPARTAWMSGTIVTPVLRGGAPARLYGSLIDVRHVQRESRRTYARLSMEPGGGAWARYAEPNAYGHIRVEVP